MESCLTQGLGTYLPIYLDLGTYLPVNLDLNAQTLSFQLRNPWFLVYLPNLQGF